MVGADVRRGEWGNPFPAELVRDFIHSALRHPTATDMVSEYVFDIATGDEAPTADIGEALRVAIGEVLSAATSEDWKRVGRDLLSDAHDTIREDPPAATAEPVATAAWWPPLPGRARRKTPVKIPQQAILDWLIEKGSATTREIAEHFQISTHTARMKSDGLVAQGKLEVRPGARAQGSRPVIERCYSAPSPPDPPAEGILADPVRARRADPRGRLALPDGSS